MTPSVLALRGHSRFPNTDEDHHDKSLLRQHWSEKVRYYRVDEVARSRPSSRPIGWDDGTLRPLLEHLTLMREAYIRLRTRQRAGLGQLVSASELLDKVGIGPFPIDQAYQVAETIVRRIGD